MANFLQITNFGYMGFHESDPINLTIFDKAFL
jgi:hypothetical protein